MIIYAIHVYICLFALPVSEIGQILGTPLGFTLKSPKINKIFALKKNN